MINSKNKFCYAMSLWISPQLLTNDQYLSNENALQGYDVHVCKACQIKGKD